MSRLKKTAVTALCSFGCAFALWAANPAATITVETDKPLHPVSPLLWGIFFEEINCAGDGGLYAELVRNRSFEDADEAGHWKLVTSAGAKGHMQVVTEEPLSEKNTRSLRLDVEKIDGGWVGAANDGWWGISVERGAKYDLRLFARTRARGPSTLTVTLAGTNGRVYARETIRGLKSKWKDFTTTLTPNATDPQARLVISVAAPGTTWLDMVSLFPRETWKNRPNGLRPDLAEALVGLKPAFLRFPGGCWVEGDTMKDAYRWKQTIGPVEDRRNQYNIWQYHSTHGLGYHEYLQLCEDLQTEPMFVINCGMSHKENVPMNQLGPFIQDALDAIEYANGPVTSYWGSRRAAAGHPKPFGLKLLEIGNENGGPAYEERYNAFAQAIKARYPEIQLIANVWGGTPKGSKLEIIDEHYYNNPAFFIRNANRYDSYDRNGPKIYVGEYAVTSGTGQGSLAGALGEAAFMMGMERNSDVVVMASYAPLFANLNYKKWNPDLIYFDSSRSFGTPSYHVQKLFAEHRPDAVLASKVDVARQEQPPSRGGIGLGTWVTRAEYKDIKVTAPDGRVLFAAASPADLQGWKRHGGTWKADGTLQQTDTGENRFIWTGDPAWTDYTLELKARKLDGEEGFLILFHATDEQNFLWWNLGGWRNSRHGIEQSIEGSKSLLGSDAQGKIETERWYAIKVELQGKRIRCYLDGRLIHDAQDSREIVPLHVAAGRMDKTGEIIFKAVNVSNEPCEARLVFHGVTRLSPAAGYVLTSDSARDENTLAAPRKVYPREQKPSAVSGEFQHVFPANSLTVWRLTTR